MAHCKKCLGRLLTGPAESELANVPWLWLSFNIAGGGEVRIRTKEGTEVIGVTQTDYILVVIQNCLSAPGSEWVCGEARASPG